MLFAELVTYVKEYGRKRSDLLVVITAFNSYENVQRHLGDLARQTHTDFDLLLVLGPPFDDAKLQGHFGKIKYPFGIVIAKESERRGCTGAFFAGQKYALENDYKYVIMADDDYVPLDDKLIENLYKSRHKGFATPIVRFVEGEYRKKGFVGGPAQYSLFSTEIFRKYGLYYLPLFHGADDAEYVERAHLVSNAVDSSVEHPYIAGRRLFSLFDRSWLFLLQAIIIIKSGRALLYNLAQFAALLSISLFFLPKYGRKIFSIMTGLLLTYTYGKKAYAAVKTGYGESLFELSAVEKEGCEIIDEKDPEYIDKSGKEKAGGIVRQMLWAWRRKVLVMNTYSFTRPFFLSIFAKKVYVKVDGEKCLLLGDNKNALLHVLKLPLFALFLPVYALALFVAFVPIKALSQPKTMRYGLD